VLIKNPVKTYDISSPFSSPKGICKLNGSKLKSVWKVLNWICRDSSSLVLSEFSKEISVKQLRLPQYPDGKPCESKFNGWSRLTIKLLGKHLQAEWIKNFIYKYCKAGLVEAMFLSHL